MALAAKIKCIRIKRGVLAMLEALLRSSDGTATIDDATSIYELAHPFDDDGNGAEAFPECCRVAESSYQQDWPRLAVQAVTVAT